MRFVPESHRQRVERGYVGKTICSRGSVAVEVDESGGIEHQSGQMSIHHGGCFTHHIPIVRPANWSVRYIPPSYPGRGWQHGRNARSRPGNGISVVRSPCGVMLPDDVAHWREIASARNSVMLAA